MKFYSIKNKFNKEFNTPFPAASDAEAVYNCRMIVNQRKDIIAADYALFFVGEFNHKIGDFIVQDHSEDVFPYLVCQDLSTLLVKEGGVNE